MISCLAVVIAAYHLRLVHTESVVGGDLPGRAFVPALASAVLYVINWRSK